MNPPWIGPKAVRNINTTRDDGMSFRLETITKIFGTYFFVSEEVVEHSRKVQDILSILAEFGGFREIFVIPFVFLLSNLNNVNLIAKSVRNIYFDYDRQNNTRIKDD